MVNGAVLSRASFPPRTEGTENSCKQQQLGSLYFYFFSPELQTRLNWPSASLNFLQQMCFNFWSILFLSFSRGKYLAQKKFINCLLFLIFVLSFLRFRIIFFSRRQRSKKKQLPDIFRNSEFVIFFWKLEKHVAYTFSQKAKKLIGRLGNETRHHVET